MYDVHLGLTGKRVVDFLLVILVLSQCTRLTDRRTDERTDGQTEFSSLDRVCIPCSAVMYRSKGGVAPRLT